MPPRPLWLWYALSGALACNVYTEDLVGDATGDSSNVGGTSAGGSTTGGTGSTSGTGGVGGTGSVGGSGGVGASGGGSGGVGAGGSGGVGPGGGSGGMPPTGGMSGSGDTGGMGGDPGGGGGTGGDAMGGSAGMGGSGGSGGTPPANTAVLDQINCDETFQSGPAENRRMGAWYGFPEDAEITFERSGGAPCDDSALRLQSEPLVDVGGFGTDLKRYDGGWVVGYDASAYTGIRFRARAETDTEMEVRFNVGDVNTHPEGGLCDDNVEEERCYDHYGTTIALTSDWDTYSVTFDSLSQQGWGNPGGPTLDTTQIYAIQFKFPTTDSGTLAPIDFWLDDVEFIE